ncbi:MAG: hypothetical protein PHS79_04050 [Patescibacteria group bacterium]|nr:hypothetical protein [Patescibacteria group bacterium]
MGIISNFKRLARSFVLRPFLEKSGEDPKQIAFGHLITTIEDPGIDDETAIQDFMELARARPELWMMTAMRKLLLEARPHTVDRLNLMMRLG